MRPSSTSAVVTIGPSEIVQCQMEWNSDFARWDPVKFGVRLKDNLSSCLQHAGWLDDTVLRDCIGLLFECRAEAGDLKKAHDSYALALELDAHNHIARRNLARLLSSMNRNSEAASVRAAAPVPVDSRHQEGVAWWTRAFYHMRMHQMSASNQCFERAGSLLDHPKLRFYAAKQLLRQRPDHSRRLDAQRILHPLLTKPCHPSFALQVLAESVRADEVKSKPKQLAQLRAKLKRADEIAAGNPTASDALRPVYDFLGQGFKQAGDLKEANRLYLLSAALPGIAQSSFAAHHQALMQRESVAQLAGLQQAIDLVPSNYAARINRLQRLVDDGQFGDAVAAAEELLKAPVGLFNRMRVQVLQGQSLAGMQEHDGTRRAFEEALPLMTGVMGKFEPNPLSPQGQLFSKWQATALDQLTLLYRGSMTEAEYGIRLTDAYLQLRRLDEADKLISLGGQLSRDSFFQRERLRMLRALSLNDHAAAVQAQISSAHFNLQFAQPGDMFGAGAKDAPIESSDWLNAAPASTARTAICSAVFRSSLLRNTDKCLQQCAHNSVDALKRAMHVLWLLYSNPVHQPRVQDWLAPLASQVLDRFRALWPVTLSHCVVVPPSCMLLAARLRSLMPTPDLKSAVDFLVGCCQLPEQAAASAAASIPDRWKRHELSLRLAVAVSPSGSRADASMEAHAFGPVAFAILRLRASELEFRERLLAMSFPPTIDPSAAAQLSASAVSLDSAVVASSPASSSAMTSPLVASSTVALSPAFCLSGDDRTGLFALSERLLREARELLDYYTLAFQTVALPDVHSKWVALKQKGVVVPVLFPCVPLRDPRRRSAMKEKEFSQLSPDQVVRARLLEYLQDRARFGESFAAKPVSNTVQPVDPSSSMHAQFFEVLFQMQPLIHAENQWLAQHFVERNQATHARPLSFGKLPLQEVIDLASTVATRVPALLDSLTEAAANDSQKAAPALVPWPTIDCEDIEQYLRAWR